MRARLIGQVWLFFSLLQPVIWAQTLRLFPATAQPGERVAIEISLKSPLRQEPSAIQWETTIRSAQLSFLGEGVSPGPASQAASKSVNCSVKAGTAGTSTAVCVLYGEIGRASCRERVEVRGVSGRR